MWILREVCFEESLYLALFFFFSSSIGCHTAKLVLHSKVFISSVIGGIEREKMAEITEQNAWNWSQKAGGTVPRKWRNEGVFIFNYSLSMLPHKLIFLTIGEALHDALWYLRLKTRSWTAVFPWISKSHELIKWVSGVHNTLLCAGPGLGSDLGALLLRAN